MRMALSTDERAAYRKAKADCRKAIEGVKGGFRLLGERLRDIRAGDWWREEYATWADFCLEELPFGQTRADQLIRAVEIGVANERQARELLGLDDAERAAVVAIAEAAGPVSAARLRTARDELEAAAGDLTGDERATTICDLVERAEEEAAAKRPASRGPRPPKDRRAAVERLVDRALHFLRIAKKEWQALSDVAEANDADWYQAVSLLEGIQERAKHSTELDAAA